MDRTGLKQLSENEMEQINGGSWVQIDGRWYWLYSSDFGDDDNSKGNVEFFNV